MTSVLRYAYVEQRCNACGGSYRVTLQDVLAEHEIQREWKPTRTCSSCDVETGLLLRSMPEDALRDFQSAWERILRIAEEKGIELQVGG